MVKTNGKYIGFLLEENAKIIGFDLVKLGNEQTKITTYTLNSYINIDVKNKDDDLKGLIEVAYLDNNTFTSTVFLEIKDDFQILSSKKISQTRKDIVKITKIYLILYKYS